MRHELKSNFIFWFFQAQKIVLMMGAFGFAYTILISNWLEQDLNYMYLVDVVFPLIIPATHINSYLPMTVGFGSKRTAAVFGIQVMNITVFAEMMIITKLHNLLFPNLAGANSKSLFIVMVAMIIGTSLGQISGVLLVTLGKRAIFVVVITVGALIGAAVMAAILLVNFSSIVLKFGFILAIAAVIIYIASIAVCVNRIKGYEVRDVA